MQTNFSGHKVQVVKYANDERIEQGLESMVNVGYLERIAELCLEIKQKDDKIDQLLTSRQLAPEKRQHIPDSNNTSGKKTPEPQHKEDDDESED